MVGACNDASSSAGSDANAAHAHAPVAAAEAALEGSGSSGSRVISAIISRSCGERTVDDDGSWAAFGKSASDGPKCADDAADVDICASTERLVCFFNIFFFKFSTR